MTVPCHAGASEATLEKKESAKSDRRMRKYGQLVFVDLAGSERLNSTGSTDVDAVKEACAINQSLFTLGQVLQGLSARAKGVTKPVRYAQLTVPPLAYLHACMVTRLLLELSISLRIRPRTGLLST